MPWPSDSVLTLQPHPYGEAAFEKVGVRVMSIWWGEARPSRHDECPDERHSRYAALPPRAA